MSKARTQNKFKCVVTTRQVLLLKIQKFEFNGLYFLRNSNSIKLEILKVFEHKLGKLVSKLKLKLKRLIFLALDMCLNVKFSSSMKLEFDEKRTRSSTSCHSLLALVLKLLSF